MSPSTSYGHYLASRVTYVARWGIRPLRIRGLFPARPVFLLSGRNGTPVWFGLLTLQGNPAAVAAHRAELIDVLSPLGKMAFPRPDAVGDAAARAAILAELGLPVTPFLDDVLSRSDPTVGIQMTPEALLWVTCPALGRDVRILVDIVRSRLLANSFPPLLSLRFVNGRSSVLVIRIVFDRKREERRLAARVCQQAILDASLAAGYPPARMPTDAMDRLDPTADTYWQLVRRLKGLLDPDGILAPGRYLPPAPTGGHVGP